MAMTIKELLFPRQIAEGARGGRNWSTDVVINAGGHPKTNINWPVPLGTWEVGLINRNAVQTKLMVGFFHAVAQGRAYGFRFNDPLDNLATNVTALRLTSTTYQLRQSYAFGGENLLVAIKKPWMADAERSVRIGIVETLNYTLNKNTGIITFNTAVDSNAVVRATTHYHIPVMFMRDDLNDLERVTVGITSWPSIELREIPIA